MWIYSSFLKICSYIYSSYRSDHCRIDLNHLITKFKQGRGIWKLNNSLLENNILVNKIKDVILTLVQTYACTPYHTDFFLNMNYMKFN